MTKNDNDFLNYFEENDDDLFKKYMEKNKNYDLKDIAEEPSAPEVTETNSPAETSKAPKRSRRTESRKQTQSRTEAKEENGEFELYIKEVDDEIKSIKALVPDMTYFKQSRGLANKIKALWIICTDTENAKRLSCLVIPCFLTLLLVLNMLVPSAKISEKENRTLAQFPELSLSSLASGKFMSEFETYISDQFVFRNHYVSAKRRYESLSGKKQNHGIIFADDGYLIENSSDLTTDNIDSNIEAINTIASITRYDVKVAIVPTAYEVLQDKLPLFAYNDSYGKLQSKLNSKFKNVVNIDVAPKLKNQKSKYVYYRSDHHQTAFGSYLTYAGLGEHLGYSPHPVEDFAIEKMADDFCGTAWSNSGFASTQNDIIYKYTFKNPPKCTVSYVKEKTSSDSLYNPEMLKTKDKYAFYLDGNHALTEIKTDSKEEKRIAIIKDSYAHSIVPFLANHYSDIFMIDLRYFNDDIFEYLYKNNINDVLFLYNQNTFMTDNNLSKITEFSKNSNYVIVPDVSYGIIPKQETVEPSYFDDAVFIGDSLTMGLEKFSGFEAEFMCVSGLNTTSIETAKLPNKKTVLETIADMDHIGKVYIMLGTNEAGYNDSEAYIKRYGELIEAIRKEFPDVIIYLESILPVSKHTSDTTNIKIDIITEYNEKLVKLAEDKQCYYVDCHSYFENPEGYLPSEISSDGIHLGPDKYRELAQYLCDHAVPANSAVKIKTEEKKAFAGKGKIDTEKLANKILSKIRFKDDLTKVSDSIVISSYKVDPQKICSAALMLGGGATAEEIAVIEAINENEAKKIESLAKDRVTRRKKDFENYIPAELKKLNNPVIVRDGNVVAICIADKVSVEDIEKIIKQ